MKSDATFLLKCINASKPSCGRCMIYKSRLLMDDVIKKTNKLFNFMLECLIPLNCQPQLVDRSSEQINCQLDTFLAFKERVILKTVSFMNSLWNQMGSINFINFVYCRDFLSRWQKVNAMLKIVRIYAPHLILQGILK